MNVDAQTLFDFATNTGSLYPTHVKLAQANVDWKGWFAHVKLSVIPQFEREINARKPIKMPSQEIAACGEMLRSYYAEHVKEL